MSEPPDDLALELLRMLDMAILRRTGSARYQFYGKAPEFYKSLFPSESDGSPCVTPWEHSPMLETFFAECEEYFESSQQEPISSGIWLEEGEKEGEELPLTAVARKMGNEELIIVQCIKEEYAERVRILRKARTVLLERRKISNALTSFRRQALHDPLTKVYNRTAFQELLQDRLTGITEYSGKTSLMMLDIDNFKKINDTYGHLAGDSVLTQLGKILMDSLRKDDAPVRYGGEEFAILAPQTDLTQTYYLAEKLRQRIEAHDFGLGTGITVSIGGTLYQNPETSENFIHRADLALYDAKRSGKNIVCLRHPATGEPVDLDKLEEEDSLDDFF